MSKEKVFKKITIALSRAVVLAGKEYMRGTHACTDEIKEDPMYKLLVKDSTIQEVRDPVQVQADVEKIAELTKALETRKDVIQRYKEQVSKLENTNTGLNEKLNKSNADFCKSDGEVTKLNLQIVELKKEIKKLKK